MKKQSRTAIATLSLLIFSLLIFNASLFASEESLTITTYYPSPYGSYRELRSQRMAIGDDYIQGGEYCWEGICTNTIDANADLVVQGNVGIGTASPGAKLDIVGAGNSPVVRLTSDLATDVTAFLQSVDNLEVRFGTYSTHPLAIYTGSTERMRIDTSGNVGIGTANTDGVQLKIAGNRAAGTHIRIENSDTGGRVWNIISSATGQGAAGNFHIWEDGAPISRIFIQGGTGNVGIGTATPSDSKFEVSTDGAGKSFTVRNSNGSIGIAHLVGGPNSDHLCYGWDGAQGYNFISPCTSSKKYKEDTIPLKVGKDKIFSLQPVNFKWKDKGEIKGQRDIGLIAEEVDSIIPELTTYDEKGEILGVKYDKLSLYLLEIVKQQDKKIEELEEKIKEFSQKG